MPKSSMPRRAKYTAIKVDKDKYLGGSLTTSSGKKTSSPSRAKLQATIGDAGIKRMSKDRPSTLTTATGDQFQKNHTRATGTGGHVTTQDYKNAMASLPEKAAAAKRAPASAYFGGLAAEKLLPKRKKPSTKGTK